MAKEVPVAFDVLKLEHTELVCCSHSVSQELDGETGVPAWGNTWDVKVSVRESDDCTVRSTCKDAGVHLASSVCCELSLGNETLLMNELLPGYSWSLRCDSVDKGSQGHLVSKNIERLNWSLLEEVLQSTKGLADDAVVLFDLSPKVGHLGRAALRQVSV